MSPALKDKRVELSKRFDLMSNNPVVECPLLIISKVSKARY